MNLDSFLKQEQMSTAAAAEAIGCGEETMRRWRVGNRVPRRRDMRLIVLWSGGKVQPNDFHAEVLAEVRMR